MPDPTEPGWRPEYTGDTSLGNVGFGVEFGADLYALYRAGRNELPGIGATYSEMTDQIHGVTGAMAAQFERPGRGMEVAHQRLLMLREETHEVLRATCLRMQEVGQVLVRIADEYAATDQAAADEFNRKLEKDAAEFANPPPGVATPPLPEDPVGLHERQRGGRI